MYYYNLGAVLTNTGKLDDAMQAFDKAIAADPNRADAYYQKGIILLGKAKIEGDKTVAPPGTAEAFNKYLELQPTGQYAEVTIDIESTGSSTEAPGGFGPPIRVLQTLALTTWPRRQRPVGKRYPIPHRPSAIIFNIDTSRK